MNRKSCAFTENSFCCFAK